jgi:hypothetical protein
MYEGYIGEKAQTHLRDGWRSAYAIVSYFAGKYDVSRAQLEAINWRPGTNNMTGWGRELSLFPLEVAARTGAFSNDIDRAELSRKRHDFEAAREAYSKIANANADGRTLQFAQHRLSALETEQALRKGEWQSWLPKSDKDLNWETVRGTIHLPDGGLEVQSDSDGHFLFSRVRLGRDFEVKGEFEVVKSSDDAFQGGLIMGVPDIQDGNWYGFRMKRNKTEGQVVAFARGWSKQQILRPLTLDDHRNNFHFQFRDGKVTASVNGKEVFRQAKPPYQIRVPPGEFMLGIGAFNDMNETIIRYRDLQVRQISATGR